MVLSLSLQGLRDSEVKECTGSSVRTLKRLQSTHRNTGGIVPHNPLVMGRQCVLTATEVKVCCNISQTGRHLDYIQSLCDCIEHQPDIALTELQTELL